MVLFVFGLIFVAAAAIVLIVKKMNPTVGFLGWTAVGVAFVGGLMIFFSAFYTVGTKEDGILTTFGATSGHVGNGPHLKWPWQAVHTMDAAVQTDTYEDNRSDDSCQGIAVRLAFQQTGCASISIQWQIKGDATDGLYKNYRSFEHVRNALVTRKLQLAANEAFADYNPLNIAEGNAKSETLPVIGRDIQRIMKREVGKQITVLSVLVPLVTYDPSTQQRINQLQQQVALTRVADQKRQTNIAESKANEALSKSVNTSPNVLVSRCLDTLEEMVKNGQSVPAGFSCWPGGSGTPVIANSGAAVGK